MPADGVGDEPRVYALADMLDIPSLNFIAAKEFEATLKSGWDPTDFAGIAAEVYATPNAVERSKEN